MKTPPPNLDALSEEELLALRFCDLGLRIEGTWLQTCIERLYAELAERGFVFRPACFLADEWLCPDGEPIIGVAYFLAHPRLRALEKAMMLEVEGGTRDWCMKLLRHEAGHTFNYAYLLHRRKRWRELFGSFTEEYPDRYRYRPYSKRFVRHLDEWYAQYHPDEDFAETFAVWLDPKSGWRRRYAGWKALDKLEYVDRLMTEISGKPPRKSEGEKEWDIDRRKMTLRTHYRQKRAFYAESYPDFHDGYLRKTFSDDVAGQRLPVLIRRHRRQIQNQVSACTGEKKYIISGLLDDLIRRSAELKLTCGTDDGQTLLKVTAYVTTLTMNYLYTGRFKKEGK